MEIFSQIAPLRAFLEQKKSLGISVGFVPTMGALHQGHLSLVSASISENQLTVCSIFVNPTQFNNPDDLLKYPRTLERDIELLQSTGCDILFCPPVNEIYTKDPIINFNFGKLETVMEGKYRPGHFNGVAIVVSKLFNIVQPNRAYFGQKDFQQCKIVERLVKDLSFQIDLRIIPIQREEDGLAMSSRNLRLNEVQRKEALIFYQTLQQSKKQLLNDIPFQKMKNDVVNNFSLKKIRLEYFELADAENLSELNNVTDKAILLIAGYIGEVRLIDNLFVHEN